MAEWDFPASALGHPRWEYLDWEDNQGDQATGTRIRLIFPYHLPTGDPSLPLDPPLGSPLMRVHELAALVETTLGVNETRRHLTVRGVSVDDLKVCTEMLPAVPGIGTRLWVDLRGPSAPRLTADRKTALQRADIDDWPSVFESVFQRWCDRLQEFLNQYSLQLVSGLLSIFSIKPKLHPSIPATPQLSRWQLKLANHPAEWVGRWCTGLLSQKSIVISDFPFADVYTRACSHAHNRVGPSINARTLSRKLTLHHDLARAREFARNLSLDLAHDHDLARAVAFARDRTLVTTYCADVLAPAFATFRNHAWICWESSLVFHLLPDAFADDLSRSFPALGVCGLKGCAGNGWLVAPGWIEWDVDSVTAKVQKDSLKEQWPQYLTAKGYDLIFPLTHIPLRQLRRNCPKWQSDRSYRALGTLAYFYLGSQEFFREQRQACFQLFKVPYIHALMPKPELWLKPFQDWTETDWNTCGLSALWDIESGVVYWAEGTHKADEMKQIGEPIEKFIGFKEKRR